MFYVLYCHLILNRIIGFLYTITNMTNHDISNSMSDKSPTVTSYRLARSPAEKALKYIECLVFLIKK